MDLEENTPADMIDKKKSPTMGQLKANAKQINEKMAVYLKKIRHEENQTMRGMAKIIGTPHSFIGKTETQDRRMDVGEFICYCRAMKRNPTEVLQAVMAL